MKQAKGLLRILLVVALGYMPAVNAALLFEGYTPVTTQSHVAGPIFGTEFTVGSAAVSVTKLGTFAAASAGITVGIWDVLQQTLMGSAKVPTTGTTQNQGWYLFDVPSFTLLANTTYRIAAQTEVATLAWGGSFTPGSGIASVTPGHVWGPQPGFPYPSELRSGTFMTANAEIAPIPEPSSYALLLAGLAGLCFVYRRRQNNGSVAIR